MLFMLPPKREFFIIAIVVVFPLCDMFCCLLRFFVIPCFRYIDQFSRCLYVEYKKSGIDVQCQVL